jgi:hypothetical protein
MPRAGRLVRHHDAHRAPVLALRVAVRLACGDATGRPRGERLAAARHADAAAALLRELGAPAGRHRAPAAA